MMLSRLTGELSDLIAPELQASGDDLLEKAFRRYEDGLRWIYEDLPNEGRNQALKMLHSFKKTA